MIYDAEDSMNVDGGGYEGTCAGCDVFTRVDDLMLCEVCAAKLDRDLIRERDWAYSATAWAVPESRREALRNQVIREHGARLELIASSKTPKKPKSARIRRGRSG